MMTYWAIAQIEPQRLPVIRTLLDRAGHEVYAPRIRTRRIARPPAVKAAQRLEAVSLLFPGYVFVRVTDDRWYPVRFAPGVVRLLMAGERPAQMPGREIEALQAREVEGYIRLPPSVPRIGARMRITHGPFAGRLALFDGMHGPDRLWVLFEFLGRVTRIDLPSHAAEPLDVANNRGLGY